MRVAVLILLLGASALAQSWSALSGTTFSTSLCPADGFGGSVLENGNPYPYRTGGVTGANTGCAGTVKAWTGGVARTLGGSEELFLLNGGGHGDYGGNESYRLTLYGTPAFTRRGDPTTLISSYYTNSTRSYSDGKPSSRHTYDQTTYVPWLDKFFLFNGSAYGGNGTSYRDGWFYDPTVDPSTTTPWTEVTPATGGSCVNPQTGGYSGSPYGSVIANPADQMIYIWYGAGWMFKLDPATSCYTSLGQVWPTGSPSYGVSDGWKAILDTSRNRIVTVGGSRVQTVSLTGTVVDVTASVGAACAAWMNSYGPGAFYDATADLYVGMVQTVGNTIYKLNPTTWACTTQTTTGGPTGNPITGMWGRFNFFPALGKIAVLADFNQTWYTLDYVLVAPVITTSSLPNGTQNSAYSQSVAATGNPAPTFSVTAGTLPTGLTLNGTSGSITGTPTRMGVWAFTVTATNGESPDDTQALTIQVDGTTTNTLTVKNEGATTSNYPVQVGRAFAEGELPNGELPQAWVGAAPVSTQVDVKARWSDNSLKHAVVSFLIPTFTSATTYTIRFTPGNTVGNTALTQGQMDDAGYDFDAVISLTNGGTTRTASARTMLLAGDYTVWNSGPIATTILLGVHAQGFACPAGVASGAGSVASKYDFGMNTRCAFRPLFEATFWATTNQVKVRYIGEIANTEQYEDVATTAMSLTKGSASPTSVYSRATSFTFRAGSRWTKTAWIGTAPPVASYNHNLAYLASAKALPYYDTSKTVSGGVISTAYTAWGSASKDLYDKGDWDIPMGGGGGHPHVGPYPAWVVQFLYSGDYRMDEIAVGQAELLATMEWHFREGKTGKNLDRAGATSGMGYPISISSRPTLNLYDLSLGNAGDKVVPVGTATNSGWDSGTGFTYWGSIISHPPETFFPLYLVTGDHFFLEEGQFQASFMAGVLGGIATADWRSRGPTGAEGGIVDRSSQRFQTRGQAWAVKSRAEMAWATPDASPFKAYLEMLLADTLAMWEGQRNITTTAYNGNTMWTHGRNQATTNPGSGTQWDSWEGPNAVITTPSPLHFWDNGSAGICDAAVNDTAVAKDCNSPWMEDYVLVALGRASELGYAATTLRNWLGENPIGALTDAGFNPYIAGAYRSAIIQQSGSSYFTTWAASKTGFLAAVQNETDFYPGTIFAGCEADGDANCQPLLAAVSMVADQTNGAAAWSFLATEILPSISGDLKWAILPRVATTNGGVRSVGKVTATGKVRQ
jgi:hypothetical protein